MSHKNVTKVVWYILVQLSSLNNAWFKGLPAFGGAGGDQGSTFKLAILQ